MNSLNLAGLRAGVAGLPAYIYYKDIHGEYIACSDLYAQLLGQEDQFALLRCHGHQLEQRDAFGFSLSQIEGCNGEKLTEINVGDQCCHARVCYRYIESLSAWCGHASLCDNQQQVVAEFVHDLKLPLHVLLNIAGLLLSRLKDKESQNFVKNMFYYVHRIHDSVMNMLAYSEQSSGNLSLNYSRTDLFRIIQDVTELASEAAMSKQIDVSYQLTEAVPQYITMDKFRLERILQNLLGNAIKFTDEGRVVLNVSIDTMTNQLVLAVVDSGAGISPERMPDIFKPFSGEKYKDSTGLGLHIVKKFVDDLSGEVSVISSVGEGTTFTVQIPL